MSDIEKVELKIELEEMPENKLRLLSKVYGSGDERKTRRIRKDDIISWLHSKMINPGRRCYVQHQNVF